MKNGKPHIVPLSPQVVELLKAVNAESSPKATYIFPSPNNLHSMQADTALRRGLVESAGTQNHSARLPKFFQNMGHGKH